MRKSGIIPKPGSITPAPIPDDFDEDLVYEDAEAASSKDEDDTLGLYTISDEGGFEEAPPETFDDEKYI